MSPFWCVQSLYCFRFTFSLLFLCLCISLLKYMHTLSMKRARFTFHCRWYSVYNFVCDKQNLESCLLSRGRSHRTCFCILLCLTVFDHRARVSLLLQHLMHDATFPKSQWTSWKKFKTSLYTLSFFIYLFSFFPGVSAFS